MVVMWAALFALLAAGRLDRLWAAWLRVALVICFALGWTLASLPRAKRRT
jgi:hypothetical protein